MATEEDHSHMEISSSPATHQCLRVVEFYAGIGGYHCALLAAFPSTQQRHATIVASIDINTNANAVYVHNFPHTPHLNRNICGITSQELDALNPDIFFLSPPCQPFTRQGLRRDNLDRRTDSFFHLMHVLSEMKCPPRYILMENVQGFELSQTRDHFVGILKRLDYEIQEFLLSPSQFGVPNSRLRFYLLAKRRPLRFGLKLNESLRADCMEAQMQYQPCCKDAGMLIGFLGPECTVMKPPFTCDKSEEMQSMAFTAEDYRVDHRDVCAVKVKPEWSHLNIDNVNATSDSLIKKQENSIPNPDGKILIPIPVGATNVTTTVPDSNSHNITDTNSTMAQSKDDSISNSHHPPSSAHSTSPPSTLQLVDFLEPLTDDLLARYLVPDKLLEKYVVALDIVHSSSNHSCCFTKAYGSYAVGTGSILQHSLEPCDLSKAFEEYVEHKEKGDLKAAVKSIHRLNLRYFTPKEVARLMCFPEEFSFPETLTRKQCYKVLGNSLNVHVVTILMKYLFHD